MQCLNQSKLSRLFTLVINDPFFIIRGLQMRYGTHFKIIEFFDLHLRSIWLSSYGTHLSSFLTFLISLKWPDSVEMLTPIIWDSYLTLCGFCPTSVFRCCYLQMNVLYHFNLQVSYPYCGTSEYSAVLFDHKWILHHMLLIFEAAWEELW